MMMVESKGASALVHGLRQRFLSRIHELGIVHGPELILVHRVAQQRGIAPEDAVVMLGLLTEDEVLEMMTGDAGL
jgi:hypothetical protein